MIVAWRYDLGIEENHREAARLLAKALGWFGEFVSGSLPGVGYAHVFVSRGALSAVVPSCDTILDITKVTP